MVKLQRVFFLFLALPLLASPASAQSPVAMSAPIGVRTFVTKVDLPPNIVRTGAVTELTRQTSWLDAPANWEWEKEIDSAGFVRAVSVYVTLDPNNTTQANGTTVCCWTYAEASLIATDTSGVSYAYQFQVTAQ